MQSLVAALVAAAAVQLCGTGCAAQAALKPGCTGGTLRPCRRPTLFISIGSSSTSGWIMLSHSPETTSAAELKFIKGGCRWLDARLPLGRPVALLDEHAIKCPDQRSKQETETMLKELWIFAVFVTRLKPQISRRGRREAGE